MAASRVVLGTLPGLSAAGLASRPDVLAAVARLGRACAHTAARREGDVASDIMAGSGTWTQLEGEGLRLQPVRGETVAYSSMWVGPAPVMSEAEPDMAYLQRRLQIAERPDPAMAEPIAGCEPAPRRRVPFFSSIIAHCTGEELEADWSEQRALAAQTPALAPWWEAVPDAGAADAAVPSGGAADEPGRDRRYDFMHVRYDTAGNVVSREQGAPGDAARAVLDSLHCNVVPAAAQPAHAQVTTAMAVDAGPATDLLDSVKPPTREPLHLCGLTWSQLASAVSRWPAPRELCSMSYLVPEVLRALAELEVPASPELRSRLAQAMRRVEPSETADAAAARPREVRPGLMPTGSSTRAAVTVLLGAGLGPTQVAAVATAAPWVLAVPAPRLQAAADALALVDVSGDEVGALLAAQPLLALRGEGVLTLALLAEALAGLSPTCLGRRLVGDPRLAAAASGHHLNYALAFWSRRPDLRPTGSDDDGVVGGAKPGKSATGDMGLTFPGGGSSSPTLPASPLLDFVLGNPDALQSPTRLCLTADWLAEEHGVTLDAALSCPVVFARSLATQMGPAMALAKARGQRLELPKIDESATTSSISADEGRISLSSGDQHTSSNYQALRLAARGPRVVALHQIGSLSLKKVCRLLDCELDEFHDTRRAFTKDLQAWVCARYSGAQRDRMLLDLDAEVGAFERNSRNQAHLTALESRVDCVGVS